MKSLVPNIVPEDKIIMERLLASGAIMRKYTIWPQTVLFRVSGAACGVGINRYNRRGLGSLLKSKARKSGTPPAGEAAKSHVCTTVCTGRSKNAAHWSIRAMRKRFHPDKSTARNRLPDMGGSVLFLDSGIGGLPYCQQFMLRNPDVPVIYAADCANFPYGTKSKETLEKILEELVRGLDAFFGLRLAVLACNTASVSALTLLRERFPGIRWVGTVPAVKPAVNASRKRHIGVLGTARTIADPYTEGLLRRYGPDCRLTGIAAPDLVDFVEQGGDSAGLDEQIRQVEPYITGFRGAGADAVVLGCTHFVFLRGAFESLSGAGKPEESVRIFDSVGGVVSRAESLLEKSGVRPASGEGEGPPGAERRNLLVLTGEGQGDRWLKRADAAGLSLRRLGDFG
ncbi:MAG: glutamate racemase [Treponema sp.]|jgi:glutamate racemase|nr:glutamate racemase [Treponema sp.]